MPNKKAECAEPSCNVCKQVKAREMEKLPKYYTGLRVSVAGIGPRRRMGTIINLDTVPPQATALAVCLDEPVGPDLSAPALHDIARPGYGVFVRKDNVRVSDDQHTFDAFTAVPEHVGVVVTEDTRVDSVTFKSGQTGRILAQPNGPTGRVLVNWNFNNRHFFEGWGSEVGIPRGMFMRCYNVPREMLAYCRLDGRGRVRAIWPNSSKGEKIDFKKGDFVRCVLAEPQRVSNGNRNYHISPGTIMKYQGQLDRQKSQVTLAGGCDPAIIGLPTIVATKGLEKLEEEFIDQGIEVEISATLNFRKRDLRGLHAVVVLPMDQDGEIGLQFQEDLEGAGSLDGHGQDKRCLYIHHSLVKKVSG